MPLSNREVIKRWFVGRRGTAHGMRTDGDSIWSHDLEIGQTKGKKKEVFNYTWSAGIQTTSSTSGHVNALLWALSDKINKALEEAGFKCFMYLFRGWWRPRPYGESTYTIDVHNEEYEVSDEKLKLVLNARYPEFLKIIHSTGRVVDLRSNWRNYAKKIKESWYLDFVTTSNQCVISAWFSGYGLRSQNLWTNGRDIRAGYGRSILIGRTKRNGDKVLYNYTAKGGKYVNRAISVGVGAVRQYAKNWSKRIEILSP